MVVCFWFIYWFVNSPSKETGKEEQGANPKGHIFASHQLKERVVSPPVWRVTAPPLVLLHLKIWEKCALIHKHHHHTDVCLVCWLQSLSGQMKMTTSFTVPRERAHWGTTSVFHSLLFQTYILYLIHCSCGKHKNGNVSNSITHLSFTAVNLMSTLNSFHLKHLFCRSLWIFFLFSHFTVCANWRLNFYREYFLCA